EQKQNITHIVQLLYQLSDKFFSGQYVIISKSGFTQEALEFMDLKKELLLWDKDIFNIKADKGNNGT
ncbi:MAG: hypothetical protein JSW07_23090, partial [bacterium]